MNEIKIIKQLAAPTPSESVELLNQLTYETEPTTADLQIADVPAWGNVQDAVAAVSFKSPVEFSFTDSASIDWQTDIAPGTGVTFAVYFGNILPKMIAYNGNDTDGYDSNTPNAHVTRSSGLIGEVTFDMPGVWIIVF